MVDKTSVLGVYTVDPKSTQLKGGKNQIMGKDDFLKLLITELTNQDPLEPMKDREMIAQMAQLSQLEQITQFTHSVDKFFKGMEKMLGIYRTLQASSLVGRWVKAEGIPFMVKKDGDVMPVSFKLPSDAHVFAKVYDASGKLVYQKDLGLMEKGMHIFEPDSELDDGTYTVDFSAEDNAGNSVVVSVYGWDKVAEVNRDGDELRLITDKGKETTVESVISFR